MFIKFADIDFLLVIFTLVCSLKACHMWLTRNHMWKLGKIYLVHFLKFWNFPGFNREISKFQKSELGKFIPHFPLKHVVTSTNIYLYNLWYLSALKNISNKNKRYPKPLNDYQCHWSSIKKETFLCSTCLELFLTRSSLF